jgi:hypothetical protein
MRKAALHLSAGVLFLAGAAVAQNVGTPNTSTDAPLSSAGVPRPVPAIQPIPPSQFSSPERQQASEAVCNADAQKFCSGKQGEERRQCLDENKASLTAACRASLEEPPGN